MGKPYSNDLRARLVVVIESGHTRVELVELYNLALSAVGRLIKRKRETGSVDPEKFDGYKTFSLEQHMNFVSWWLADRTVRRPNFKLAWRNAR